MAERISREIKAAKVMAEKIRDLPKVDPVQSMALRIYAILQGSFDRNAAISTDTYRRQCKTALKLASNLIDSFWTSIEDGDDDY